MSCSHPKIVKRKYRDGKFDWMCHSCGQQVDEPQDVSIVDPVNNSTWLDSTAKVTTVSLILPKNITFQGWAAIGPKIARVKRFTTWALADWLNYGEANYGEMYAQDRG